MAHVVDGGKSTVRIGSMVGDGIGHEVVPAAMRVVDAAVDAVGGPTVEWVELPLGRQAIESHGSPIPEETLASLDELDSWILGPHDSASYPEPFRSSLTPGGTVRKHFALFANIRPAVGYPGIRALSPRMNLVVVRENTEGFYSDRNMFAGSGEFMPTPDVALAVALFTRSACERIAREAFVLARGRKRHVTIVHKTNVLAMTTGLFRDACRAVGEDFPDVTVDEEHIDALAAHLVRRGEDFDVIVAENMFGDILSDLAGELSGSLGLAPSINASETKVMAQAAHGSAPDIAGRNRANPTAMILSAAMMLDWLAQHDGHASLASAATRISSAVSATLESGVATADLGGQASTSEFTETVAARCLRR